ncbi:sigma factor-like helix-turn-helix DNA-binding protein [Nocardia abscessus]|uniref:sigma factor-like helix-turn-helix DNA-binding protein n=1 Tax=Nocardia abscessus TaxID=120957 RepID=UPI0002D410A2|nr:sigma factor-like helix-turn-helix DNA-binding protein [Nocardia abscessus]MCC3333547.1 sigma-70 region 4 domain-containing protein [Nocardia abscessus]
MLDSIRRQEQAVALSKVRYLLLGDRYGMTAAEMAEAVGMSESGVRSAIARAKSSPGEEDGVSQ